MPRLIDGVAYSEDYEAVVGPIPASKAAIKAVTTDTGNISTVDTTVRPADGSGAAAR